ncbi:endoribonuclease L-PSP [Cupriavidus sp. 2MCAB6]|uniref:chorismate transformation enzyme, FkbO/Hyg5 family n=1 Tax=Cupriavidus sp. 2MCAB6 TaxID=3232981 RepID=UPI003F93E1C7
MKRDTMNATPLRLAQYTARGLAAVRPGWLDGALGAVWYGGGTPPAMLAGTDLPLARVATPPLGEDPVVCEVWHGSNAAWDTIGEPATGRHGVVDFRTDAALGLIFGSVTLREADFANAQGSMLQSATERAYRDIFGLLDAKGYPYLVRVWNYVADINAEESGMERYRQFNIGRQAAFTACRREIVGNVPAACALGAVGQPVAQRTLSIGFLASPRAPVAVENPRQVSAYHYPAQYGPRSPTFARAGVWRAGAHDECAAPVLFVSGTASIVGHRTVHAGDVAAQTRESIANIAAVLEQAARDGHAGIGLPQLAYRVYVRHPQERGTLASVRAALEGAVGHGVAAAYVQADICRGDLLVEIEASAGHGLEVLA